MKVYVFDLIAYGKHFETFKQARYIPYPLAREHFDPDVAARTFEEHIEIWKEMDKLGYDGIGLNEHHTTPHSLMNSPNMMAAVAAQHTRSLKFLMLGNLLPLHNPLRVAEELAMADCLSRGRVIAGFARGVPREYNVYGVPMAESRARFEEAYEIIRKAWTEEVFSHEGRFWSYKDIAIWPRPFQQPHPPVWVPFTGSKETIEWAARNNLNAVLPDVKPGLTEDIVGYFGKCLASHGRTLSPDQLCLFTDAFVAESKAAAIEEYSPCYLYFTQTLWHHGSITETGKNAAAGPGYVGSSSHDYIRPENRAAATMDREKIRTMTVDDVKRRVNAGELAWGSAAEVTERLIAIAERSGVNALLLNMNVGAMPHAQFLEQIRRFGRDVLPALQAHQVRRLPRPQAAAAGH
jgi:alkanesulfonate monooxygenase SsuD/methylene tetrahydromethanopterin reductase-like flavin-dependent oxidoreductase (luciferase family)